MSTTNEFTLVTHDDRPFWVHESGKTFPVISGGDGPEGETKHRDPNTGKFVKSEGGQAQPTGEVPQAPPQASTPATPPPPAPPAPEQTEFKVDYKDGQLILNGQPAPSELQSVINTVRQEEKDKVYGRLEDLNSQVSQLTEAQQRQKDAEDEERRRAEEEQRRQAEEEMDVRELIKTRDAEWEKRLEETRQENERLKAAFDKEREFSALQNYTQGRIEAERDNIMPDLLDLVRGNTPEEVDQSIALMKQKTATILENVSSAVGQQPQGPPSVGPGVTAPAGGPVENQMQTQTITPEQISQMSMAEYAKHREQLLQQANPTRGMYG